MRAQAIRLVCVCRSRLDSWPRRCDSTGGWYWSPALGEVSTRRPEGGRPPSSRARSPLFVPGYARSRSCSPGVWGCGQRWGGGGRRLEEPVTGPMGRVGGRVTAVLEAPALQRTERWAWPALSPETPSHIVPAARFPVTASRGPGSCKREAALGCGLQDSLKVLADARSPLFLPS